MDSYASVQVGAASEIDYIRPIGAYKPKFQGIPDDYYPLTALEVFKYSVFVVGVIGGTLGVMIGFLFWQINTNLRDYTNIWSSVLCLFIATMMVLFYIYGKDRIRQEREMIEQKQAMEKQMAVKKLHHDDFKGL